MRRVINETLDECAAQSDWSIAACAVEETHVHMLMTPTKRDIDGVLKWLAQRTTKAVHQRTSHLDPVWCHGRWRQFIYDQEHWDNTLRYIQRHARGR